MIFKRTVIACLLASLMAGMQPSAAANFSANFQNTDIHDFVDIVSQSLNRPMLVDPTISGKISVRSYEMFSEEQYYQFFLSVLDVYGFSVIPMDNGILKVVRSAKAKTAGAPVADAQRPGKGDETLTRIMQMHNVPARDLAPILRQLNDNSGIGNVVHYEPSNVLVLTGRATVINRLVEVIERIDAAGQQQRETVTVKNGSAKDLADLLNQLSAEELKGQNAGALMAKAVADSRTNTLVISGSPEARRKAKATIAALDTKNGIQGNTRVFYLNYANAAKTADVLRGISDKIASQGKNSKGTSVRNDGVSIAADPQTNSLVITAQQGVMSSLEQVIAQLDIRRSQVLVEAIIAEVQDGSGLNLGIQWLSEHASAQFADAGVSLSEGKLPQAANGLATGLLRGDFSVLLSALATDSNSEILSTPSVVTLDNKEASFNAGQEVPVLTGSRTTSSDNIFNTVERKTIGTRLKVTPQINNGETVQLKIEQEVSSVDNTTSGEGNLGPTFNTRTITNEVLVRNGQTVVLGGLIEKSNKQSVSKVPLLGDIPLVGQLFRYTSNDTAKRNLMVFIRTTILPDDPHYAEASNGKMQQLDKALHQRTRERMPGTLSAGESIKGADWPLQPAPTKGRNPFRE